MLGMQALQEDGEAVRLDLADGHAQCLYTRRGDGQKGVCAHGSESMPSVGSCPARALVFYLGAVRPMGLVCLAFMSDRGANYQPVK